MTRRLVQSLTCAAGIVALAAALGLLANAVSSAGIPLVASSAPPGRAIALAEARQAYEGGDVAFIDARPHGDYRAGHIAGAVSVPLAERAGELDHLRRELARTRTLVVYCDGGECASASLLSAWLVSNGWRDVRVLGDGYPIWAAAGFPVARGESP